MLVYDHRAAAGFEPPVKPVLDAARQVSDQYAEVQHVRSAAQVECHRRLRTARKAKGLCRVCGEKPHRPERTSCSECGAIEAEQTRKQYASTRPEPKRRRREQRDAG